MTVSQATGETIVTDTYCVRRGENPAIMVTVRGTVGSQCVCVMRDIVALCAARWT